MEWSHLIRRCNAPVFMVLLAGAVATVPIAQADDASAGINPRSAEVLRASELADVSNEPGHMSVSQLSADVLVQQVLQRNPGIEAMQAAADAATSRVESARALDDPMVSYAMAPQTAGGPGQGLNQNVQISQKFPWPGTLDLLSKMTSAEAESADRQVADLRLRLAARARADYAQWYYVHRALAINAENSTLVERLRGVAESAYASGQAPQQDVLQAEVELVRLRNQALELTRLQSTVQSKINGLQNLDPSAEVPTPADLASGPTLPTYVDLRKAALAHYPMLQSLDAQIAAGQHRVDLARKANLPNVSVLAGYNSLMDLPEKRFTVGIAVNIPFGGNHRGEVNEANAHLHESKARLEDVRSQLLSDLDQTRTTAAQDIETIRLYNGQLLPLSKLNMQAAEADYSSGGGDFLKLITAEQQYLMAELELARARADCFTQLASLNYQTGGALWPATASFSPQEVLP